MCGGKEGDTITSSRILRYVNVVVCDDYEAVRAHLDGAVGNRSVDSKCRELGLGGGGEVSIFSLYLYEVFAFLAF